MEEQATRSQVPVLPRYPGLMARAFFLAAVLLVSVLPVRPGTAKSNADVLPRLGAVTRIEFTEPSFLDVRLEADAIMRFPMFKPNPDLEVGGAGRFAGLLLIRLPVERNIWDTRMVLGGLYRTCVTEGCVSKPYYFTHPEGLERLDRIDLPPGTYRLVLINDGAPVSITLSLEGPGGEVTLPQGRPIEVPVRQPTVHLSTAPLGNVFSAGQTDEIEKRTLSWTTLWLAGRGTGIRDEGTCVYKGVPPGDERLAYTSECYANGADGYRSQFIEAATYYRDTMAVITPFKPGVWSHGVFMESAAVVEEFGALNMLIPY